MSQFSFDDFTTHVFQHYEANNYSEAYDYVAREAGHFPEHYAALTMVAIAFITG